MPRRTARTTVPFTASQMYDLVVDMDRYPEFLPWCVRAHKYEIQEKSFKSEMTFAFKGIRETFHTLDKIEPGRKVTISHLSGPFSHLNSKWLFTALPRGSTVDFCIDFHFKSPLLNLTLGPVFAEASRRMVDAFERRARVVYAA